MHFHHILNEDGLKIALYEKRPKAPYVNVRPILLIHSATFSSLPEYDLQVKDYSLMDFLAGEGVHVFAVDIRGYGNSEKPSPSEWVTTDVAAKDVHAAVKFVMDKSGVDRINMFGWSWGTQVAGLYAQMYPDNIDKLVLSAPFWHGLNVELDEVIDSRRINTPASTVSDFLNMSYMDPEVIHEFTRLCMELDRITPTGSWKDLKKLRENPILDPTKIRAPVLIIYGKRDHLVIKEDVQKFHESLASDHKRIVVIENADHMAHLELNHHVFFSELAHFLR